LPACYLLTRSPARAHVLCSSLSLHDALPISPGASAREPVAEAVAPTILVGMTVAPDPLPRQVSDTFDPRLWREVEAAEHGGPELTDITYHRAVERVDSPDGERTVPDLPSVSIAFDRPQGRSAIRPNTIHARSVAL